MSDNESRPLQAVFDIDDADAEVVEGTGFEPGVKYHFTIEKMPTGKFMQYGAAKGGLFVLSKKCPEELAKAYQAHPDNFEIFSPGEVNGQQVLVPGKDFAQFRPYLSKIIDVTWVHNLDSEGKRLIFMSVNAGDRLAVNPGHPEWESPAVRLSRKLGYIPPDPKSKEKFSFSFLHPGINIMAEVVQAKQKNKDGTEKLVPKIDIDTIELVDASGKVEAQKTLPDSGIDPEIRETIKGLAEGCKNSAEVIRKVKKHLTESGETELQGKYVEAISKMRESKEILA